MTFVISLFKKNRKINWDMNITAVNARIMSCSSCISSPVVTLIDALKDNIRFNLSLDFFLLDIRSFFNEIFDQRFNRIATLPTGQREFYNKNIG